MAKKKKLTKAERKEARLRKGKQWLLTYTGSPKKMNKHYRERFHVDAVTAAKDLQELDAAVLRAFIDRIEVSHVDKKSRTREITIVYNFIGAFDFTRAIENARNTSKKEQRTA